MGLLDGKVVFITGGAQGQGRAHAVASAREGADVAVLDVARQLPGVEHPMGTPEGLAETARLVEALDRRVLTFEGDVRSQSDLDKAVARTITELGAVDAVIANAGIWTRAPFWEMTEEAWLQTIDVDLNGAWRTVKAVAPHMIERQSGSIVITSSGHGLEPGPDYANYVAAKHGLVGLMKSVALEIAPYGVRANAILPGAVNTPMANHPRAWELIAGQEGATEEAALEAAYRFHALKGATLLPPETVADAAVFLNSDLARAVTGVAMPVDAGHLIMMGHNHAPVK